MKCVIHTNLFLIQVFSLNEIISDSYLIIIALFYSGDLSIKYLSLMLLAFIILLILRLD